MSTDDRRRAARQNMDLPIRVLLSVDDAKSARGKNHMIPGKMCNQSEDGLGIEIDRCLASGSNVRIKIAFEPQSASAELYYIRDGLVRWCERLAAPAGRFGAGIKIMRKVVQVPVLTSRFVRPASSHHQ
jgi:hypothetical protein